MPVDGSSERSISFSSLQRALCSFLSLSRIFSYASQVLPSNTSDLIHLLIIRYVSLTTAVGIEGGRNLLHQVSILKYMQRFLLSFPVFSTYYHECFSGTTCHLERFVSTNNLLYKAFQIVSEFVYTDDIHNPTIMYGNSVQLYSNSPNKAKHGDRFFVARELGIHPGQIYNWRRQFTRLSDKQFNRIDGVDYSKTESEAMRKLKREMEILKKENEFLKKDVCVLREIPRVKYALMDQFRQSYTVRLMCRALSQGEGYSSPQRQGF